MINHNIISNIQHKQPKIHSITNTITINDCANIILAAGGSATMASAPEETAEMTALCDGLVLNLGAVSSANADASIQAMLLAGKKANRLGHPVVLDPVAAGATSLRRQACQTLLREIHFTAIRGNATEIHALAALCENTGTVPPLSENETSFIDVTPSAAMQQKNVEHCLTDARRLCEKTGAIVVVSGIDDLIVLGDKYEIHTGGSPLSARITGSGCMLTELISTCLAANPEQPFEAVCTAVDWMNDAAEKAARKTQAADGGTMTFRMYLIDEIYKSAIVSITNATLCP